MSITIKAPHDLRATLATMKSAKEKGVNMNIWDRDIKVVEDAIATIEAIRAAGSFGERDDLLKANQILQVLIGNRDKEVDRLRKGIQDYLDGNYENPRRHRPDACKHGLLWYQGCESCDEEHFAAVLRSPSAIPQADSQSQTVSETVHQGTPKV